MQLNEDIELLDADGATPYVLAVNSGNLKAIAALTTAGASRYYRIHWAAQNGHTKVRHATYGMHAAPVCLQACQLA